MHAYAIVACLAAALRPVLAATSNFPPQFFFLQSRVQPGQSSTKSSFNNLYLSPITESSTLAAPVFVKMSAYAKVLTAEQTSKANGSAPAMYDISYNASSAASQDYLLTLQYNLAPFAGWAPANFLHSSASTPTNQQNQFVFHGSEKNATLLWSNANSSTSTYGWIGE